MPSPRALGAAVLCATAAWALLTLGALLLKLTPLTLLPPPLAAASAALEWHYALAPPLVVAALLVASYAQWLAWQFFVSS